MFVCALSGTVLIKDVCRICGRGVRVCASVCKVHRFTIVKCFCWLIHILYISCVPWENTARYLLFTFCCILYILFFVCFCFCSFTFRKMDYNKQLIAIVVLLYLQKAEVKGNSCFHSVDCIDLLNNSRKNWYRRRKWFTLKYV